MEQELDCRQQARPAYDLSLWLRHPLFALRSRSWFQSVSRRLDYPIPMLVREIEFCVYLRLMSHLSIILGRRWEENEHKFLRRFVHLANCRVFWDVGANAGLYSFFFLSLNPAGTAFLFEPDLRNLDCLRRTIRRRRLHHRALVFPAAVAETGGVAQFWEDSLTGSTGSLEGEAEDCFIHHHHGIRPLRRQVRTVTLDEVWQAYGAPQFIKIDVEGAEERVLQGARKLLAEAQPTLLLEISCPRRPQVMETLRRSGYEVLDSDTLSPQPVHSRNVIALPRHLARQLLDSRCA